MPSLRGIIALGFVSMPIPVFLESYEACKVIQLHTVYVMLNSIVASIHVSLYTSSAGTSRGRKFQGGKNL